MRVNLDAQHGLIYAESVSMALAKHVGKRQAHHLVRAASERAQAEGRSLRDILASDPGISRYLTAVDLERLFDPLLASGQAQALVARILKAR
jgi:3-carboxy-cis,cis-muconate cycloisomerase